MFLTGKKGIYTGASGLTVAYLSGAEGPNSSLASFDGSDIDALRMPLVSNSQFKGVDVLLASPWPKGVEKYAVAPEVRNVRLTF